MQKRTFRCNVHDFLNLHIIYGKPTKRNWSFMMINDFFYKVQCRVKIFREGDGDKQNTRIGFFRNSSKEVAGIEGDKLSTSRPSSNNTDSNTLYVNPCISPSGVQINTLLFLGVFFLWLPFMKLSYHLIYYIAI